MEPSYPPVRKPSRALRRVPAAAILGAAAGLFVSGYWLVDAFPASSRLLLALTALAGVAAGVGYFLLLGWIGRNAAALSGWRWVGAGVIGAAATVFLLFAGTNQWKAPSRYLTFLLPVHQFSLSFMLPESTPPPTLAWFNTSLGDVSYSTVNIRGWKRVGEELVLENPTANALQWRGRTGDKVQLIFGGTASASQTRLSWDGQPETLVISGEKTNYGREFGVPFFASATLIILLGLFSVFPLSLAALVVIWQKRSSLGPAIRGSTAKVQARFNQLDLALVTAAATLALVLRAFNLANVFPAVDEYFHLIAAQQIVHGAALSSVYPRGLWLVTLPVAAALRVFGHELWAARMVGVVVNALATIPLYLLGRKVSRPIAVLACVLFATSPWIITFARVAREYAYYPFYFYWIILGMVSLIESIPQGFIVSRDWKALLHAKPLLLGAALIFPPIFALSIDWLSTFRTILIAYLVLGLFVLGRFDWRERSNWPVLVLIGMVVATGGRAWYLEQSDKILLLPRINTVPLEYFLPNPQQQWYFDRVVILIALGILCAAGMSIAMRRVNFVPLFIVTLFICYLAVFALISKTFFHTRHLLTTQLWYVLVTAIGLYALWKVVCAVSPFRGSAFPALLAAVLAIAVTNVPQILLPTVSTNPDMPISEDYLHDLAQVQAFMLDHAEPQDVLISTVYGLYAAWEGTPTFDAQYRITTQTPEEYVLSIVNKYPTGWIVVDKIRLDLASMSPKALTTNPQIEYIGLFGDEYVWRWPRSAAAGAAQVLGKGQ